jgi:hypothetical protein
MILCKSAPFLEADGIELDAIDGHSQHQFLFFCISLGLIVQQN